jgi:hypothetical protein
MNNTKCTGSCCYQVIDGLNIILLIDLHSVVSFQACIRKAYRITRPTCTWYRHDKPVCMKIDGTHQRRPG